MSRESDLLFGLLALQMNFVSKEHLLEGAAVWMNDPKADLASFLLERKFIKPSQHGVLLSLVEEQLKANGGDAGRSLAAAGFGRAAIRSAGDFERTIALVEKRAGGVTIQVAGAAEDRYRLGAELGEGGLGRVVEATDMALGREVAVKLALDEGSGEVAERFVREAKLAGRLEHPAIVPVYDFGALPKGKLFLCMKRVRGRDLGKLLKALAAGDKETRRVFTRARLIRIVQDVCQGMAYAHDHGVIHRDLKPANVMIGDYGETLIVDWGLAGVRGERAEGREGGDEKISGRRAADRPALTLDGEILGTPAYMSPEQAVGAIHDVDVRSDIYALGAILYEVLTLHAPFEGKTAYEILDKVRSGRITPPSSRAGHFRPGDDPDRTVVKAPSTRMATDPIPPELDAICLKALAFKREDRFQTATELHDELQLFAEGVKERERKQKEARDRAAAGRAHFERYRALRGEIESQDKAVKEWSEKIKPHQTPEEKRPLWDAEARLQALREERIGAFSTASAEYGQALAVDPTSVEAADGKCELFLDKFLEAERKRNREEMLLNRNALLQTDGEGRYRAKLDAPGKLSLRAFAYGCDCLRPVRHPEWRVEIAEKVTVPWRDGRPRPDLALLDTDSPVPAMTTFPEGVRWGHVPDCPRRELPGVEVRIAKYGERDKRLVLGEERRLGVTPLAGVELPQGSYRCTLKADGFADTLLPVRIDRGGAWSQDVNLYRPEEIPAGFRCVPGGPFTFSGEWAGGTEAESKTTEDLFVATFPVTCGEYLDFLNGLCATGRIEEARKRQPREGDKLWWIEEAGRFRLPAAAEDPKLAWDPRWAVFCVNWSDSIACATWTSKRDGIPYRLMHEQEWEKAARGVDGRLYSYGDVYDGSYSHTVVSVQGKNTPKPVGAFPVDESPYGIRDLSGGIQTWCGNSPEVPWRTWLCVRGGAWSSHPGAARAGYRHGNHPGDLVWHVGLRLAVPPSSGAPRPLA